jgi:hypothetical protein
MDGWSATRSREVRSNRVGGNDTGSWLLESSDSGSHNSYRVLKAQKRERVIGNRFFKDISKTIITVNRLKANDKVF